MPSSNRLEYTVGSRHVISSVIKVSSVYWIERKISPTLLPVRVSPKNVINRTPIKIIGNKKRSALAAIYYFDSPCYCYGYGGASDPDSIRHCVALCLHPYTERRVSLWEFYRVLAVGKRIILLSFYEVVSRLDTGVFARWMGDAPRPFVSTKKRCSLLLCRLMWLFIFY